jgi:hypothetical protein
LVAQKVRRIWRVRIRVVLTRTIIVGTIDYRRTLRRHHQPTRVAAHRYHERNYKRCSEHNPSMSALIEHELLSDFARLQFKPALRIEQRYRKVVVTETSIVGIDCCSRLITFACGVPIIRTMPSSSTCQTTKSFPG